MFYLIKKRKKEKKGGRKKKNAKNNISYSQTKYILFRSFVLKCVRAYIYIYSKISNTLPTLNSANLQRDTSWIYNMEIFLVNNIIRIPREIYLHSSNSMNKYIKIRIESFNIGDWLVSGITFKNY